MADRTASEGGGVPPLLRRLPKDALTPEAQQRLTEFTRRVGVVLRVDSRGHADVDRAELERLVGDRKFFSPSASRILSEALEADGEPPGGGEAGPPIEPITEAEIEKAGLPERPALTDLERFVLRVAPDIPKRVLSEDHLRKLAALFDPDTSGPPADPQPAAQGSVSALKACLKRKLGVFALAMVFIALGALLIIVTGLGPIGVALAVWCVSTFGATVAAIVLGCLDQAGFNIP